jgi:hypothetical protein
MSHLRRIKARFALLAFARMTENDTGRLFHRFAPAPKAWVVSFFQKDAFCGFLEKGRM